MLHSHFLPTYLSKPLNYFKHVFQVFAGMAYFNLLGVPLFMLPVVISDMAHARVSLIRLYKFLSAEEVESQQVRERNDIVVYQNFKFRNI